MKRLAGLLLAVGLAATTAAAHGQTAAQDADAADELGAVLEILGRPETAKVMARFSKAYYDALLAAGFTQEQSIRILVGTGIPGFR